MTKYVANCLLAMKISFINEMANICEGVGADIQPSPEGNRLRSANRLRFLFPGVGYGGSCFPKDVRALMDVATTHGVTPRILEAVDEVNIAQKEVLFQKLSQHFAGDFSGRKVAVWGLVSNLAPMTFARHPLWC